MFNDFNISGRVGQVGTDYLRNQAFVRAIRGIRKTRPNPSQPVPATIAADLRARFKSGELTGVNTGCAAMWLGFVGGRA
jgi:hypothetical protein